MAAVKARFEQSVKEIGELKADGPVKPSTDDKLMFYGLFKQANVGDVNTDRPGMFDMQGKYKWDAWKKNEGMSKEKAQEEYVKYFFTMLDKNPGEETDAIKARVNAAGEAA
ncbi:acyl-CoA-binding protein (ACBP)/diazepam binding inhibitor (DBI)/endozepine (EP) [Naganishia albida]|nr:acyl-CoA-binding protein (ACBP)/diazepam binding inhibitor (DBI)/endozepine (EP) [Naganishia albida]